jgi:hypothetical protein
MTIEKLREMFRLQIVVPFIIPDWLKSSALDRMQQLSEVEASFKTLSSEAAITICGFQELGFSDYIGKQKDGKFLLLSEPVYQMEFPLSAAKCEPVSVKEKAVYFDYGFGFIEITADFPEPVQQGVNPNLLDEIYATGVELKEAFSFRLLSKFVRGAGNLRPEISDSFSISVLCSLDCFNGLVLNDIYNLSVHFCGEYCSAATVKDFNLSSLAGLSINHGFTGSFYVMSEEIENRASKQILGMTCFLYFIASLVPELSFKVNAAIEAQRRYAASDRKPDVKKLANNLDMLRNLKNAAENILFGAYPQNVSTTKTDASIYDKAINTPEFEKYLAVLKDQLARLDNVIQEISAGILEYYSKKVEWTLRLISLFAATSVFADIFTQIDISVGYYFLLIPLGIVSAGFLAAMRK